MRLRAPRARRAPIALRFQLLWHEVLIDPGSEAVHDALRYLAQRAAHSIAPKRTMQYTIGPDLRVCEEGDELSTEVDARGVLDTVYQRVHQRAFEFASLTGWVRVHGALATMHGRRVLIVGDSGVGKTTLSCRLLFDGVAVHGDESVVLRDGQVLAVARPFHLKPGIDELVPELTPSLPTLPLLDGDPPIRAFDPAAADFEWTIDDAPIDEVVVATRVTGDATLTPMRATDAMPTIVDQVFRNQERRGKVLGEVAGALRTARCWRLGLGDVGAAAALLERAAALD